MTTIEEVKKIIEEIINSPTNPLTQENEDFIDACEKNEIEKAQEILKRNPDLDINWSCGPLDFSDEVLDWFANEEICNLLEQIPKRKTRNNTALGMACSNGHIQTVHYLLGLPSIDINRTASSCPLRCALSNGHSDIAILLLKNKKLEKTMYIGGVLMYIASNGLVEVFNRILAMGWIITDTKYREFTFFLSRLKVPETNPQKILARKELTENVALFIINPERYKRRVKKELCIS